MSAPAARRRIRRLDRATVERIAAGEVVERPASVVKELAENAVDAGASSVTVRLEGGGLERIEVADDGTGIPPDELALAFERHATSKIDPESSLEEIRSLGFRGEALASIAAVARVRLLSRPFGAELAEGLAIDGGEPAGRFAAPRARGTTVEVRDLFYNTPARRKFLRAPAAELVDVVRVVEHAYLARPGVGYRLESAGRELASLPGTGALLEAAARVLGPEFRSGAFPVRGELPGGTVDGVLALPGLAAPTSTSLYLAVNGRPVASRPLAQAVRLGYGDALPRSRFPVGVVHLTLDHARVDVNVHPTKREVRFARERELADALRRRVREALVVAHGFAPTVGLAPPVAGGPAGGGPSSPGTGVARDAAGAPAVRPPAVGAGQRRLDEGTAAPGPSERAPVGTRRPLRLLGPIHALYWAAESDDGLVLVDQHAASERYLFEQLRRRRPSARQTLVDPLAVELPPAERAALEAYAAEVRDAGFDVEPFGPGVVRLLAVPSFRGRWARPSTLLDLLRELAEGGRPTVPDALADRALATVACHAAVRAGDAVEPAALAALLRSLEALPERVATCPHGRPITVELPRSRLDRWFLREGT